MAAEETRQRINAIIESLPSQCRTAFVLSRQRQLSNQEIATEMDISISTVEKHIGKALRIIRDHEEKGLFILVLYTYIWASRL